MIKSFNGNRHLDVIHRNRISEFLEIKWRNDKNNFLMSDSDKMLLAQLPDEVIIEIYKNFLYKDFLFKFRRMFNLYHMPRRFFGFMQKKADDSLQVVGERIYSRKRIANLPIGDL